MTSQQIADQLLAEHQAGRLVPANDDDARTMSDNLSDSYRASRIEMYADWLQHDADGLAFNLTMPRIAGCTATMLSAARAKVACALELIDNAIKVDREANEKEPA